MSHSFHFVIYLDYKVLALCICPLKVLKHDVDTFKAIPLHHSAGISLHFQQGFKSLQ